MYLLILFSFGFINQKPNKAIPSNKYFIKAPAKWKNSKSFPIKEVNYWDHYRSKLLGSYNCIKIIYTFKSWVTPPSTDNSAEQETLPAEVEATQV